jgi:phospholipid/cholesterol/gamma-HCH transport system substrate-binding protein
VKKLNLETKVGLFFTACFVLIAFISLKLGNYQIGEAAGYSMSAVFDSAAGINNETAVLMAGLRVGQVADLKLEKGKARVFMRIKADAEIPLDSSIGIQSRGFLGAKYLEIAPGSKETFYEDGAEFAKISASTELTELSGKASGIADDVKAITANLRTVFGGEEGEEGVRDIFVNLQEITHRLAGALEDNQQRMNQIATNLESMTGQLAAMSVENRVAIHEAIGLFPAIAQNIEVISGNVAQVTDSNNVEINHAVKELSASSEQLRMAMEHIASITRKIDEGEGTIGQLINDKETIEELSDTLDSINEFVGRIRRMQTKVGYRGEYYPADADLKSFITLRLQPRPDKWYEIGLIDDPFGRTVTKTTETVTTHDAGGPGEYTEKTIEEKKVTADNLKISAQIAKRWRAVVVRGGLIESHAGVGAELNLFDDHLVLAVEGSDFADDNNPRLKANMDFLFLDHFFVTGGADDLVHASVLDGTADPRWFVGGGLLFTDEDISTLITKVPLPDL